MVMKKLNLRLIRKIQHTKGQFIAIMLLVAMGTMVYVALSMAIINLESSLYYYYNQTQFADLFAQIIKIPDNKVKFIQGVQGVQQVEGRIVGDIKLVESKSHKINGKIISYDTHQSINQLFYEEGQGIQNPRKEALLIKQYAAAEGIQIGDSIELEILNKSYRLQVAGIVSSPEFVYMMEDEQAMLPRPGEYAVVYVDKNLARESLGLGEAYNELVLTTNQNPDTVKKTLEKSLDKYGLRRLTLREDQLSHRMVSEEIKGVKQSSKFVPIIFLGAAAMTIALMISRIVKNDRTSIGVMKALGYGNGAIVKHYTVYAVMIGVMGAILGVVLGTFLSGYMAEMYRTYFEIPYLKLVIYYQYILFGIGLSGGFCVVAGLMGARPVLRIDPAESMRPEAPKRVKNIHLDKLTFLWKRLSFSWKMVMRNMLRSKKRFVFIIAGIAMTYANILFVLSMISSVYKLYEIQYEEFQTMDYVVNFTQPMHENQLKTLESILHTPKIEPRIEYPFTLQHLWKEKVVNVIGLERETQYYHFKNDQGEPIKGPESGIYLTEGLAKYLGVSKGDAVFIKSFLPDREDVEIVVSGIVKQALGLNAYMNLHDMQGQLVDRQMINAVMLDSDTDIAEALKGMKNIGSIQSDKDMKDMFSEFLGLMIMSTTIMVVMAGFIGFAIIYSTTIVNINERQLELGSLRIMGFSKNEIYKVITKENAIMSALGVLAGVPLGQQMAQLVVDSFSTEIYSLEVYLTASNYLLSGVLTLSFVLLAQLMMLRKIHRIDFMEALKNRMT